MNVETEIPESHTPGRSLRDRAGRSCGRIAAVLARDLKLSPRSPVVLMAIVMPIMITLIVRSVFGGLLDAPPTLGIVAPPGSTIAQSLDQAAGADGRAEGVEVSRWHTAVAAADAVADGQLSAALILPDNAEFESALAGRDQIEVRYLVAGDTLAVDRAILAGTTSEILRGAAGQEPAVTIKVEVIGDEGYIPIADRVLPLMVIYVIVLAGLFVPAASLMDERTKGTLDAVLYTPMTMGEVLAAKGIFAGILSMALGVVTLAINGAFAGQLLGLTLALLVGTVMLVLIGLLLGMWAKNMNSLYTWIKAGGILIVLPALVLMFPGVPQWVGQITPTYYFLGPVFELSAGGSDLGGVLPQLSVAVLISIVLVPLVLWSARRLTDQQRRG